MDEENIGSWVCVKPPLTCSGVEKDGARSDDGGFGGRHQAHHGRGESGDSSCGAKGGGKGG